MFSRLFTPAIIALQLLTRLPTPRISAFTEQDIGRSALFYPFIGLVIGLFLILTNWVLFSASIEITAALLLILWVIITGALHIDGLGDSADAWLGGYGDRKRTLEIMKDPSCGPAAVTTILLVLLGKYAALQQITEYSQYVALLIIPVLSRSALIVLLLTTPYVRNQGMGSTLSTHIPKTTSWIIVIAITISTIALIKSNGIILLSTTAITLFALRYVMMKRINGTTGDTAGAAIEIIELILLMVFSLFCIPK